MPMSQNAEAGADWKLPPLRRDRNGTARSKAKRKLASRPRRKDRGDVLEHAYVVEHRPVAPSIVHDGLGARESASCRAATRRRARVRRLRDVQLQVHSNLRIHVVY